MFTVARKTFRLESMKRETHLHRVELIHLANNERGVDQNPYVVQILEYYPSTCAWLPCPVQCASESFPDLDSSLAMLSLFPGGLEVFNDTEH